MIWTLARDSHFSESGTSAEVADILANLVDGEVVETTGIVLLGVRAIGNLSLGAKFLILDRILASPSISIAFCYCHPSTKTVLDTTSFVQKRLLRTELGIQLKTSPSIKSQTEDSTRLRASNETHS